MTLDSYLGVGIVRELGTHLFEAEAIKEFARKFDPQPFHVDEAAAARSVLGGLCASGWHTAAVWMRLSVDAGMTARDTPWDGPGPKPVFGPSPGFKNLKWLKPVYAGETIRFTRTVLNHRALASRPGWLVLTVRGEAFNPKGDKVLEFDSGVMVRAG
jgi:acyl dehydratase